MKGKIFKQFFKFLLVGFNNTGIDFLILNLLMFLFHIYKGWPIIFFNVISFSIAVTNSYLINRFWTFRFEENKKIFFTQFSLVLIIFFILINLNFLKNNIIFITLSILFLSIVVLINFYLIKIFLLKNKLIESSKEFGKFVSLTIIGMLINTSILYFFTSSITPLFGFSKILWVNFSKTLATCVSLFWNFVCYKFVVFKG